MGRQRIRIKTMRKLTHEKDVESYLSKEMSRIGLRTYKFIPDQRVGMPDRLVTLPNGRVIWIEMKTDGGHLSLVQELRHRELREQGQRVEVLWTKADVDAFSLRLQRMLADESAESCT